MLLDITLRGLTSVIDSHSSIYICLPRMIKMNRCRLWDLADCVTWVYQDSLHFFELAEVKDISVSWGNFLL